MSQVEDVAKPKAAYMVNSYLEWAEGEGVPIVEDFAVDLGTTEVAPWARIGARGGIYNLKGRGDFTSIFLIELPQGGKTSPQKHLYEEIIYVIAGHGSTTIEGPDGHKHSFEWGPKSLFAIPLNCRHQHFNGSGSQPARLASTNNLCMTLNLYHDDRFIFENDSVFADRMGKSSYFEGDGDFIPMRPGRHMWETNFIPDLTQIELKPFDSRGPKSTSLMFIFANGTMGAHSSEIPVGSYKKAHRHDSGRHVFAVTGNGYSLAWYVGDEEFLRIPWHHGVVYAPPDGMFHQHFNISRQPARYLATGIGSRRHPFLATKWRSEKEVDVSVKEGGRQIEYEDQDPRIHRIWLEETAKAGITSELVL
jgi:quercetin dioxygenase-like cupin family protein